MEFEELDELLNDYSDDRESFEGEYAAMMSGISDNEDVTERKRPSRAASNKKRPVTTATGRSAYRAPQQAQDKGYVTQKQLQDALGRVGSDVRRNALGIKTINTRLGAIDTRVDAVVAVNTAQSQKLGQLDRQMRLDGALDVAQSISLSTESGQLTMQPNLGRLLQGAIKSGLIGTDPKGAFSNPALVGGIGFLLSNPAILGNILGGRS
jgi:hypothetical protein